MGNDEELSMFDSKVNQVCELQIAEKDYLPVVIDKETIKSLRLNEVILS